MTTESQLRFEELDAGRVLGDLDQAEFAEWKKLSADHGLVPDTGLDLFAAEVELISLQEGEKSLPADLTQKMVAAIPRSSAAQEIVREKISFMPWLGWAIAACLLGLLTIPKLIPEPSSDRRLAALLDRATDANTLTFKGTEGTYAEAGGEVTWSDSQQKGFLTLTNLPSNNSAMNQYQLWIVDPKRDEFPVDGGVFDILPGQKSVVIPIDAKLAIKNPAAFVITLEQPGGVVRSKQEIVVAIASS